MTDYEIASALNIIAEAYNSRTVYIDVPNRFVSFEGPEDKEAALAIAVEEFMRTVEFIEIEPAKQTGIKMINKKVGWDI